MPKHVKVPNMRLSLVAPNCCGGGDERFGRRKISSRKMAQRISQIEDGTDGVV